MITWILLALLAIGSFVIVLSFLVFFHELGHYSVARFFGVAIEKFSIGYGRAMVSWTSKSGTKWQLSRIPFGGFVKFLGDAGAASNPDAEQLKILREQMEGEHGQDITTNCFHFKPLWQRTLIVLAGPIANFILAIFIFSSLSWSVGVTQLKAVAGVIVEGQAAQLAGLQTGDEIITIAGKDAGTYTKVLTLVATHAGDAVPIAIVRDGAPLTLTVTPRRTLREDGIGGDTKIGYIGMGFNNSEELIEWRRYGPLEGLVYGADQLVDMLSTTVRYIGRIFQGKEDGKQLGSVVKIAAITGKVAIDSVSADITPLEKAKLLFFRLISLAAAISIGLGVANLMPIPVLDGGHLVYYGYEAIAGRPLSERKQELGFKVGLSFLLALFLFLTWNDIGYVQSLFS